MKILKIVLGILSILAGIITVILSALFLMDKLDNVGYAIMGMMVCLLCNSVNCTLIALDAAKKKS